MLPSAKLTGWCRSWSQKFFLTATIQLMFARRWLRELLPHAWRHWMKTMCSLKDAYWSPTWWPQARRIPREKMLMSTRLLRGLALRWAGLCLLPWWAWCSFRVVNLKKKLRWIWTRWIRSPISEGHGSWVSLTGVPYRIRASRLGAEKQRIGRLPKTHCFWEPKQTQRLSLASSKD